MQQDIDNLDGPDHGIQLLRRLGFPELAARVYVSLLQSGPELPTSIRLRLNCSADELGRSLRLLMKQHLVQRDHSRGKTLYYISEPERSWIAYEAALVWSTQHHHGSVLDLPHSVDGKVRDAQSLCNAIRAACRVLYVPRFAPTEHKVLDTPSPEDSAHIACDVISLANTRVRAMSRSPRLMQVAQFWTAIEKQISLGITYQRIADLEEAIAHGTEFVMRDITTAGVDLRILPGRLIPGSYYLADTRLVAILNSSDEDEAVKSNGRVTSQREIVKRFSERWNRNWKIAMPAHQVVRALEMEANSMANQAKGTSSLREGDIEWFLDICRFGKFSRFHLDNHMPHDQAAESLNRLAEAGFIVTTVEGETVASYPSYRKLFDLQWPYSGAG